MGKRGVMKRKLLVVLAYCLSISCQGFAKNVTKQNANNDLDFLYNLIGVKYAPLAWKELLFGWNRDERTHQARLQLVLEEKPTTDYCQKVFAEYISSLNDYHAGITFYRSESAYLPYLFKLSEDGRLFVVDVQTPHSEIYLGDEIIEFDGMSAREALESIRVGRGSQTDYSTAARNLTARSAALGHLVPSGIATLKVRRPSGFHRTVTVRWRYTPENIGDFSAIAPLVADHPPQISLDSCYKGASTRFAPHNQCLFNSQMLPYFWSEVRALNKNRLDSDYYIGSKKGFLPNFGPVVWEQVSGPYRANIFEVTNDQGQKFNVGFLRISTYVWTELEDLEEGRRDAPWLTFGEIIDVLESKTHALIIDQTNNPGGSVFYMYGLLSMLTSTPLEVPKHRMILTQDEVSSALKWREELEGVYTDEHASLVLGESMEGYHMDMRAVGALQQFSNDVLSCWASGDISLSKPISLLGFDMIYPNPNHQYTKPIFMLINEENFSCGDLAPTILKDNNRATLIGKPTAGAGGFVFQVAFPNRSGIKGVSLTGSLAVRKGGEYIENLGVSPHIDLGCSPRDLQTGKYSEYINTVKSIVVAELARLGVDEKVAESA